MLPFDSNTDIIMSLIFTKTFVPVYVDKCMNSTIYSGNIIPRFGKVKTRTIGKNASIIGIFSFI